MSPTTSNNKSTSPVHNLGSATYQTFVELPYRAVTVPRQRDNKMSEQTDRDVKDGCQFIGPIDDKFHALFTSPESVSTILAKDPSISPGDAWDKLYGHHIKKLSASPHSVDHAGKHPPSEDELKKTAECGHWGPTQPSQLFLTVGYCPYEIPKDRIIKLTAVDVS